MQTTGLIGGGAGIGEVEQDKLGAGVAWRDTSHDVQFQVGGIFAEHCGGNFV